jgi:hypothetical protein
MALPKCRQHPLQRADFTDPGISLQNVNFSPMGGYQGTEELLDRRLPERDKTGLDISPLHPMGLAT